MSVQVPAIHSVHVYDHDNDLIARLSAIVSTGLRIGDSVLIVATPEHRDQLVKELGFAGIDVRAAVREGRYTMLDARETLAAIMRNDSPDRELFRESVGKALALARLQARSRNQGLTVFGEMVAALWDEGLKSAALELEALWNEALSDNTFHLHCAYPRASFIDASELRSVCETHSHVLQ